MRLDEQQTCPPFKNYLFIDTEYQERIRNLNKGNDISENIKEISKFTVATLDYGIDITMVARSSTGAPSLPGMSASHERACLKLSQACFSLAVRAS